MKVPVRSQTGTKKGSVELPEGIFNARVNEPLLPQAVRVYQTNQRQGTAAVKSRGDVVGSRRKIWPQKGTGRARHGDRYAPIFVGGGKAHGPKPKDWTLALSAKMKRKALISALSVKKDDLIVVDTLEFEKPKTKEFAEFLEQVLEKVPASVLVITPEPDNIVYRSARNIPEVAVLPAEQVNAYHVLRHDTVILVKQAVNRITELCEAVADTQAQKTEKKPQAGQEDLAELDLTERQIASLTDAGITSQKSLADASDEDLQAISGIGPKTVEKIRQASETQ